MGENIVQSRHRGVVLGLEHFESFEKNSILQDLLSDPTYTERITGLWLPKNILDHDDEADIYAQVANGARAQYEGKIKALDSKGTKKFPTFRLFCDTSSSGGPDDTLEHINTLMHKFPAEHMTFTVTPSAFAEVIESLQVYSDVFNEEHRGGRYQRSVDFLLATAYPENDLVNLEKFTKMNASEYTKHVSQLAEEYDLAGVVGSADLAAHTIVGQYYLALGVCVNGSVGYDVMPKLTKKKYTLYKRLTSPETTYRYATNTEAHVGRTLFDTGNGEFMFPRNVGNERLPEVLELVKSNLAKLFMRLDNLPEPEKLHDAENG